MTWTTKGPMSHHPVHIPKRASTSGNKISICRGRLTLSVHNIESLFTLEQDGEKLTRGLNGSSCLHIVLDPDTICKPEEIKPDC
jgi:hypothetical protein